jgi:hypothetical protein
MLGTWRLGVPFLVSISVLMPIAYYPTSLRYHLPGTTDFNFLHFWWHALTVGSLAVGVSMVLMGATGARCDRRAAVGRGAPGDRRARETRLRRA